MAGVQQRKGAGEGGAEAQAKRVMRVTTPGPMQVMTFGFFGMTMAFFGLVYTLAPQQLVMAARMPEGAVSPEVLPWIHMIIRGWGSGMLGVVATLMTVGMYARTVYLVPVVVGAVHFIVYSQAYHELDHEVFPPATVYTHLALAVIYVFTGWSAYSSMPAPVTYELTSSGGGGGAGATETRKSR